MQLFRPEHYAAFDPPKPDLDDPATVSERLQVRQVLLELDSLLWPFISSSNWDLHRHRQATHYVSSHTFIFLDDGRPIVKHIESMWLHYGKSPEQLDFIKTIGGYDYKKLHDEDYFNAFFLHTRLQFYINASIFRSWLILATDKNYYDRSEFLRKLSSSQSERDQFYQLIKPLFNKGFYYEIDAKQLKLDSSLSQKELISFVKKDQGGVYSGIVKDYLPDDERISIKNIQSEMIENLKLLYPLYDFMAWRPPKI